MSDLRGKEREERALMEALQKPSGLYIHGPRILAHAARKESRKHARTRKLPEKVPTPEEFSKLPRDEMHRQYRQLWEWMHGRPKGE